MYSADSPIAREILSGLEDEPSVPRGYVRCSFCRRVVSEMEATRGMGRVRKSLSPNIEFEGGHISAYRGDTITHFASPVVACPDHSLEVRSSLGQKWPTMRG